jgi:hypothetical protein
MAGSTALAPTADLSGFRALLKVETNVGCILALLIDLRMEDLEITPSPVKGTASCD